MKKCPRDNKEKGVPERSFFSTPHQPVILTRSRVWVLKLKGLSNPAGRAMATSPHRDQHSFRSICDLNTYYRGPLSSSPCPSHSFCRSWRHPDLVMLHWTLQLRPPYRAPSLSPLTWGCTHSTLHHVPGASELLRSFIPCGFTRIQAQEHSWGFLPWCLSSLI